MEKRGRALDANESHAVLLETAGRKSLVSWFKPFFGQMHDAVKKGKKQTILGGMNFNVRISESGNDVIFMIADGFVPMTRISKNDLARLAE